MLATTVSNSFRGRLRRNSKAGRHICVSLAARRDQVPGNVVRDQEGFLLDPLTALAWFNFHLVKLSWLEASAYRLSLRGYADFGRRGLEALLGLVETIHVHNPCSLVLLDALAWEFDYQDQWSAERIFKEARSLGVDAVIVSPCAGCQELEHCFLLAAESGKKELEVFVACQGCIRSQRAKTCFNPAKHLKVGNDRWLDFLIGHLLSYEERAGIVLTQVNGERFYHLRSMMAANSVSLLMPSETLTSGKGGMLSEEEARCFDLGLIEISAENLCRNLGQIRQINELF